MKRLLVLAVMCFGTATAHAQLTDGATFDFVRLYVTTGSNGQTLYQPNLNTPDEYQYFNYAHCVCSDPNVSHDAGFGETQFGYLITLSGTTATTATSDNYALNLWTGTSCDSVTMGDPQVAYQNCTQPCGTATAGARCLTSGISNIATLATTNGATPLISYYDLMTPGSDYTPCLQRPLTATEWAAADTIQSGQDTYFAPQTINTDSQPPPTPVDITATGGDGQITLSWTPILGNTPDIYAYQVLCADASGNPITNSPPKPLYMTPRSLCGAGSDATFYSCDFADEGSDECMANSASSGSGSTTDAGIDAGVDGGGGSGSDIAAIAPVVDAGPSEVDAPPVDAPGPPNFAPFQQLSSKYICGQLINSAQSATSITITGLTNYTAYSIVLLSMDEYQNVAGVAINKSLVPKPVTDFWGDIHGGDSQVKGGFCLIADTYGDDNPLTNALRSFRDQTLADTAFGRALTDAYYASVAKLGAIVHGRWPLRIVSGVVLLPVVIVALLWHYLTLPGLLIIAFGLWLRRRMIRSRALARLAPVGVVLFVIIGGSARAHAQAPYWENQATGENEDEGYIEPEHKPKWHLGIKGGPYTPDIDSQSTQRNTAGQGPYQAMFGGYQILPEIDFDRFLWSGFGQVGVGISVGYMQKSAHPFVIPSDPSDPDRPRSAGDTTGFHLLPVSVTAVYRFSWLDDEYGIPIVPYVRAGLAYYGWWSTLDGHLSNDPGFGKALGASAGLVGAAGIAIRAERIDATAARAMRESGIQHAGFYGEINDGWVDGFGHSTKLDVGGWTWFAGIELEF